MPYFMAAACFLFFSARPAAVSSALACVAVDEGGGADTGSVDVLSIVGDCFWPPKHMRVSFCRYVNMSLSDLIKKEHPPCTDAPQKKCPLPLCTVTDTKLFDR